MVSVNKIKRALENKHKSDVITDSKSHKQFSFTKDTNVWYVNLDQLRTKHGKRYVYRRALIGEINLSNPELSILSKSALLDILSKQIARKIDIYLKNA